MKSKRYSIKKRLPKKNSRKRLSKAMLCNIKLYKNLSKQKHLTPYEDDLLQKLQGSIYLKTKENGKEFLMPFKLPPGWLGVGSMGNDNSDKKIYPNVYDYYGPKCSRKLAAERIKNGAKKIKNILKFKVQIRK